MDFLRRFSNSLFAPKDIIPYAKDKWYVTLLFFILLTFISTLPFLVSTITNNEISYEAKRELRVTFSDEKIPFSISNGKLIRNDNSEEIYSKIVLSNLKVIFTSNNEVDKDLVSNNFIIAFKSDGVYLIQSVVEQRLFRYDEYDSELNGINFMDATYSNINFWNRIFSVANKEYSKIRAELISFQVIYIFLSNALSFVLASLAFALFQSVRTSPFIKFSRLWKLCIYLLTPYVIGNLLAILFNISLLYYAGFFVSAFYAVYVGRTIINNSIRRE